jgi:hypothetical protein
MGVPQTTISARERMAEVDDGFVKRYMAALDKLTGKGFVPPLVMEERARIRKAIEASPWTSLTQETVLSIVDDVQA